MEFFLRQSAFQASSGLLVPAVWIIGLIAFGILMLSILRPYFFPKNESLDNALNTELLEGKGVMTKDELRRVRNVMVRQAMEKENEDQEQSSIDDLSSILVQAESRSLNIAHKRKSSPEKKYTDQTTTNAPIPLAAISKAASKPIMSLIDIQISSTQANNKNAAGEESTDQPATVNAKPQSGSVDIKTLLDKGLISQAEYEKISGRFSEENQKNQG